MDAWNLLILLALLAPSATSAGKPPLLILVSFDGFRHDYLDNNSLPYITKHFVDAGVLVRGGLLNVFPTVTYPNHWSLATGRFPESSGVVANVMFDPVLNETFVDFQTHDNETVWFDMDNASVPIWILNELDGTRRSGLIGSFPGGNVPILGRLVSRSLDYKNELNWFERVDALLRWLTDPAETERVNMVVLYFPEPDETGHEFGPASDQVRQVLTKCDLVVGYLMTKLAEAGLEQEANVIITSDHGMDSVAESRSIDLSDFVETSKFKVYGGLTQINIFPNDPADTEAIYAALKRVPNYQIYRREEVPTRLHYSLNRRIGPLVMFPEPGFEVFRANRSRFDWSHWKGDHGYDNRVSSMHPVFVARGPSFKRGHVSEQPVRIVDIYALMSFVLGLEPAPNNGSLANCLDLLDRDAVISSRSQEAAPFSPHSKLITTVGRRV